MSINKNSEMNCKDVQLFLSSNEDEIYPEGVQIHLQGCPQCKQYAATIGRLSDSLSINNPETSISPDSAVKHNLLNSMSQTNPTNKSIFVKISDIFAYRIPLYQAASAVAIILILFFTAENISDISIEQSGKITNEIVVENVQLSTIYLLDSLNVSGITNIGRNALEDSAITKYMVTTL